MGRWFRHLRQKAFGDVAILAASRAAWRDRRGAQAVEPNRPCPPTAAMSPRVTGSSSAAVFGGVSGEGAARGGADEGGPREWKAGVGGRGEGPTNREPFTTIPLSSPTGRWEMGARRRWRSPPPPLNPLRRVNGSPCAGSTLPGGQGRIVESEHTGGRVMGSRLYLKGGQPVAHPSHPPCLREECASRFGYSKVRRNSRRR